MKKYEWYEGVLYFDQKTNYQYFISDTDNKCFKMKINTFDYDPSLWEETSYDKDLFSELNSIGAKALVPVKV